MLLVFYALLVPECYPFLLIPLRGGLRQRSAQQKATAKRTSSKVIICPVLFRKHVET